MCSPGQGHESEALWLLQLEQWKDRLQELGVSECVDMFVCVFDVRVWMCLCVCVWMCRSVCAMVAGCSN